MIQEYHGILKEYCVSANMLSERTSSFWYSFWSGSEPGVYLNRYSRNLHNPSGLFS
jgi:hypothetical protein